MLALSEHEFVVVIQVLQGGGHLLVAERPVAVGIVEISPAILQPEAEGFALGGADQVGVGVAAADVGERSDGGEDLAELVGALPGDGEGADAAAAGSADRALVGVAGQGLDAGDRRENFFEQEAGVLIAQSVILKAAIGHSPGALGSGSGGAVARIDEDADGGWHGSFVNELVENRRHPPSAIRFDVVVSVLKDHHGQGCGGVGFGW